MHYGVPSKGKCDTTGRVKILMLYADSCADELWLTRLDKALSQQTARQMTIELQDGTRIDLTEQLTEEAEED